MKKKLLVLFTIIMVLVLSITIVACTDYVEEPTEEEEIETVTRSMLITNGTFYDASTTSKGAFVQNTVKNWTATKGSIATTATGVTMGAIDMSNKDTFDANSDILSTANASFAYPGVDPKTPFDTDDFGNPTDKLQDTNALLLASVETAGSIYYKNSNSFTLEANKYYLLQYSVCTNIESNADNKADKGAWVTIAGGISYKDNIINTDGKWETHYLYIESNKYSSKTIDIYLWLGNGPDTLSSVPNKYIAKGAVLFDNIICKEVAKDKDGTTEFNHTSFINAAIANTDASYGYESCYFLSDTKLEQTTEVSPTSSNAKNFFYSFREGIYTSSNVSNYTLIKGKSGLSSGEQPTVNTPHTGIVDLSKLYTKEEGKDAVDIYKELLKSTSTYSSSWKPVAYENWKNDVIGDNGGRNMTALDEQKALMIFNGDLTGAGFKSNSAITIKSNTYYVISVWAYVDQLNALPTANKPTSPAEYTEKQKAYRDAIKNAYNATIDYEFEDTYFVALTEAEKAKIIGDSAIYKASDESAEVIAFKAELLKELEEKTIKYRFEDDAFKPFEGYQEQVYQSFKYYYLWLDNKDDAALDQTVKDYLEYQMLTERNGFINGDYKNLTTLETDWADYDDKLAEYLAKYNAWLSATSGTAEAQKPYAHVKLTGAGDDIVEQTTTLGQWEQLTFYIQGNQLSDRKLNLEFWMGEGSSTDYTTLMMGSVFFDNIEIAEYAAGTQPANTYQTLNPIDNADELEYGGLTNEMDLETFKNNFWGLKLESNDVASSDLNSITYNRVALPDGEFADLSAIGITSFAELVLKNSIATASVLTSKESITIDPNTAYRIAMLVKTADIDKSLGVTINLLGGDKSDDLTASVASATSINNSEWQEIVFYVLGDTVKTNYVTIKIQLGTGTRFNTASYVKGEAHIALINVSEIKYSEFSSTSKSGDMVKEYTFSNTAKATDSVTNGSFSGIDLSATNEKEFGADGKITGTAVTSNWTAGTVKNNIFTTPTLNMVNDILDWEKVYGVSYTGSNEVVPSYYEIWARYKDADNKYQEKYIASVTAADDTMTFPVDKMFKTLTVNYKIRAVGKSDSGLSYYDVVSAFSNFSGEVVPDAGNLYNSIDDYIAANPLAKPEIKYQAGTVLINKAVDFAAETGSYVSPYDTMLKISSNYALSHTLTSSNSSLTANSYYKVSVWVKTIDNAEASVTLSDVSDVLSAKSVTGKYIGFTGINTQGKWVQYSFYVKMGSHTGTLSMQLSLGNAYVDKVSKKSTNVKTDATVYDNAALSSGTVFFDNIQLLSIKEEEYTTASLKPELTAGNDNLYDFVIGDIISDYEGIDYKVYTNKYALRILESVVDSFDSFTQNTVEEGKDGYNLGHTPNNYAWAKADTATGSTEDSRVYGVYSQNEDPSKLEMIFKKDVDDELVNAFSGISNFPENFNIANFIQIEGNNSLVMSNKELFGQTYSVNNTSSINSKGYYKITFKAKTLIAAKAYDANGNAILDGDGKQTYTITGANAEFRFMPTTDNAKYQSIYINSNGKTNNIYEAIEYTMYVYNPSATAATANWSFILGQDAKTDDTTGSAQMLLGMMVIDQVGIVEIDKEAFDTAKTGANYDNLTPEQKLASAAAFYTYAEDAEEEEEEEEEPAEEEEEEKEPSIWTRGDAWLLISSIVIAVIIIVVMVVLIIRRWKKKHPKEVRGENILKAEKDIKVIEPEQQFKEEFIVDKEYVDDKPKYVQRVVSKKKKPNNKGKK